ncbi:PAS domain S-box protein [Planktothrix agardhii]|uniref:PAS domain S-box protein n=1 Tax=Planktothrix agardhii TaxID=1160 RepID=UPI0020A73519|nr:PAS domain S-box protein [Planktothrix agardhii]
MRNPLIVAPDTTVRDAITQMSALHTQCSTSTRDNHPLDELHLEARSSCVLIAENQKLLGILTERDVVRLSTEKRSLESLPVREVMAHPVVTLYESAFTDLFFVINLLKQHRIRHLPILNDQDQIVGLLTHETLRQTSRPTDLLRLRLVAEVMIANVVSVSPNSPILQIAELMAKHRVSSVVIVQEQDSLFIPIGFVTERDLVQCQALNLDLETCMADQVMNISVFPVRKDHSLWVVQQIMEQHLIRHLVVTGEKGELLGIITQTNILQALNPLELYKLAEVLEQKVSRLEAEKIELLSHRNLELERQVEERTAILKAKAKQEELITNLATQIRSSLNLSEILKTTVEQIRSHLNCDRTVIWQLQTDSSVIVVAEASSSQIEAALIESQNSYITLAAAVPVGIFRTDTQGNCIYVNTSWCSMTGLTPSKAIGGGWTQAIHPQDRDKIVSEWYFAVHENRPFQLEYRYQRPDGLITWVFGQAIVERDINGEIIGYVGTATDITQRKQDSDILENLIEGTSAVTGEDFFPAMAEHISKAFELDRIVITELRNGVFCKLVDFSNHQFQADHVNEDFEELYAKSDLGLALQNQAGESLGYIAIWNNTLKNSSNLGNIIDILRVFATRAEAEIERLRVTEALEQRNQELRQAQSSLEEFNLSLENLVRQQTKEVINLNILQKAILDAADYSIISTDLQGVIQTFNAGAEKMLGYRAEEVIGKVTLARIHDRKELKIYAEILSQELNRPIEQSFEVFIALCKGGIINDQEWIYIRKDGSDFPVSLSINALKDINQQIIGFLAIAKDISQRKQVELERQKLLQELSAFKQGLDQSAIVSITDTKGVIIYVNDRFCEISGYSRDELIGKTHRLINSGYHPSDFFKQLWRTIIQGKVWRGEICNRTRKGDLYWVDSTIVPFLDSYGKPFQYLGIRFDISDRKKIEVELAKSEAQFRGLVEGANDLIWSFDLDGLYTYLSPQFETLFGWKPSEWIGKSFVDLVHPDDLEMLIKNNHQYILAGETSHNLEIRHLHRDGHYLWVRISATAIKNEQGTIIGRQGILSDISDRKQYEVQLQQTNLELARATRMKDEFLANMSHELRTPLNAILGMSEAMQEEIFGPLNQKQHQSVQTIEKSGTHLLALINDILDVAKIESGKIELNCTPTPITELCESSLIFIKQQALKKRISIQTEISPYLPNLLIDERRIRQVLINLLNNAIKFTPEGGGVSLTVKLESSTETALSNHYISFAVTDTGIGIAHENLAKLFQPFVQIDSALNRQYMGTGLGLTLVKKIVEIHGGEVKVKSTIDLGSCFAFRLPCQDLLLKSPQSSQETAVNLDPNSTTQVSEKFPIILLAEDHEANIITISRYLKAKGYQIILAENGQEAIDQAKLHRPDLILMDIQMPVMDGLEAIQRIREDSDLKLANIPIIALTALAMTSDKRKCLEAGANDYLAKPVKLSQLTSTIQEILAQEKN